MTEEHDEPGTILFAQPFHRWDSKIQTCVRLYLQAVAEVFSQGPFGEAVGRRVLASYDLFNEADILAEGAEDTLFREVVLEHRIQFITLTFLFLKQLHGSLMPQCTVGWGFMSPYAKEATARLRAMGVEQAYLSSHSYQYDVHVFRRQMVDARNFADSKGLPYVCSEFWERRADSAANHPRAMAPYLDVVREENIGSQIWGFLAYNLFDIVGGILREIDGFVMPRRYQFGPPGMTQAQYAASVFTPLPWPAGVGMVERPPRPGDREAVARWVRWRAQRDPVRV